MPAVSGCPPPLNLNSMPVSEPGNKQHFDEDCSIDASTRRPSTSSCASENDLSSPTAECMKKMLAEVFDSDDEGQYVAPEPEPEQDICRPFNPRTPEWSPAASPRVCDWQPSPMVQPSPAPQQAGPVQQPMWTAPQAPLMQPPSGPPQINTNKYYRVAFRGGVDLLMEPTFGAMCTGVTLKHNDVIQVCQQILRDDGLVFLRLADGRGWAFDDSALNPEDPSVVQGHWAPVQGQVAVPQPPQPCYRTRMEPAMSQPTMAPMPNPPPYTAGYWGRQSQMEPQTGYWQRR